MQRWQTGRRWTRVEAKAYVEAARQDFDSGECRHPDWYPELQEQGLRDRSVRPCLSMASWIVAYSYHGHPRIGFWRRGVLVMAEPRQTSEGATLLFRNAFWVDDADRYLGGYDPVVLWDPAEPEGES